MFSALTYESCWTEETILEKWRCRWEKCEKIGEPAEVGDYLSTCDSQDKFQKIQEKIQNEGTYTLDKKILVTLYYKHIWRPMI